MSSDARTPTRLFCFPYAGGGASVFRDWQAPLLPKIEVHAIQLPGREERRSEAPFTALPALIECLAKEIDPYLDQPFAFFGHSMGTLIAFELTRSLRRQKCPQPSHLFLSAYGAPHLKHSTPKLHQLPDLALVEQLRRLNGTPEAILREPDIVKMLLPTLRADLRLVETYAYHSEALLDMPITAFWGTRDHISQEKIAAWREQTRSTFFLQKIQGNHFFIHHARPKLLTVILSKLIPSVGVSSDVL